MMKIERLSRKSEPKQKTFTITAPSETELTPEQELDVLYGRILANLFETWQCFGPCDFREKFCIDSLYQKCIREVGVDKLADRIHATAAFAIKGLKVWNAEPVEYDDTFLKTRVKFMEEEESDLPLTIIVEVARKK